MAKRRTEGAKLLRSFIDRNGLTLVDAAKALHVSSVAVLHWTTGERVPKTEYRGAIAVWTSEQVPAASWESSAAHRVVAHVQPFTPPKNGTDG